MNQRLGLEAAMIECQRLWDETQDVDACITRHPQYETDIRQHFALADALRGFKVPAAREQRRQQGWQELSGHIADKAAPAAPAVLRHAAAFGAVVFGVMAIGAAGAATKTFEPPAPMSNFIEQIGTIPEYIGVGEALLPPPPPPPPQPTATPTPPPTATPTPEPLPTETLPMVAPSPVAPTVVPAFVPPVVIPAQPQPSPRATQVVATSTPTPTPPARGTTPIPTPSTAPTATLTPLSTPGTAIPGALPGNSAQGLGQQQNAPPIQASPAATNPPASGDGNPNAVSAGDGSATGSGQTKNP